jgi:hypothetical protein
LGEEGIMEYTFDFDKASGLCTVCVSGKFKRPESSRELQRLMCDIYDKHGYVLFLFDLTNAVVESSTLNAFDAAAPPSSMSETLRKFQIAIVYSKLTETDRFFENVAVNRAYRVRVFDDRDKAIEWLDLIE